MALTYEVFNFMVIMKLSKIGCYKRVMLVFSNVKNRNKALAELFVGEQLSLNHDVCKLSAVVLPGLAEFKLMKKQSVS